MKKLLDKFLSNILVGLMALMLCSVLWQVFSRYVLNMPSSVTEELARYLLIWIGVLGAAYTSGQLEHFTINLLSESLDERKKIKLHIFQNVLIILFVLCAFIIGGMRLVYITFILDQDSPALNLPLSFVYLILPISGVIIILYKILEFTQLKSNTNDH